MRQRRSLYQSGKPLRQGWCEMDTKEMKPLERYNNDALFHTLVDSLVALVVNDYYTVRELKEAVALAQLTYEMWVQVHGRVIIMPRNSDGN